MTKEEKLDIVKTALIKVVSAINENFPWLDYNEIKYGRDSSLSSDRWTAVYIYYQKCTDKEGKDVQPIYGYQDAKYYNEIYGDVGPKLEALLKDEPYIKRIMGGTFSNILNVPEYDLGDLPGMYYGVILEIDYTKAGKGFSDEQSKEVTY